MMIGTDSRERLGSAGAQFAVLLARDRRRSAPKTKDGIIDDIATGDAAATKPDLMRSASAHELNQFDAVARRDGGGGVK